MRSCWQLWAQGADQKALDWIEELAEETPSTEATIFSGEINPEIRTSQVKWINSQELRDWLFIYVMQANANAFNIDVQNMAEIQYTIYNSSEQGHYNSHHDINWSSDEAFDRKISVTVQLSSTEEYEGGDFYFDEVEDVGAEVRTKGAVLVFPSYLRHRVTPVTRGVRKSLVAWFKGPRWR